MTFVPNNPTVGSRIRIDHDVEVIAGTYTRGHEFTITEEGGRGWSLRDDNGNELHDFGRLGERFTILRR